MGIILICCSISIVTNTKPKIVVTRTKTSVITLDFFFDLINFIVEQMISNKPLKIPYAPPK